MGDTVPYSEPSREYLDQTRGGPRVPASPSVTCQDEEQGSSHECIHIGDIDQSTPETLPLTAKQVEDIIQNFIISINKAAVCDLASKHHGGRPCKVTNQRNGSFNICFFIAFEDADVEWILRIPIQPVVSNAWAKVESEVTTIRYIQCNTTIPVPHIYAYGRDETLVEGASTPFMLMDCMHGCQLHTRTVLQASAPQRRNLYIDLINVFAQLRKLEFPAAGSLMPNPDNDSDPLLGPFLSMTVNEYNRKRAKPLVTEAYTSVKPFIDLHCHMLSETFQLPTEELELRQARMEVFALESVLTEVQSCINMQETNTKFILAHPDLRCGNIIVDDDFRIVGIIDWEFASAVPRQLFIPPSWITGNDPDTFLMVTGVPRGQILQEFGSVLKEMHKEASGWTQLWRDWGLQPDADAHNAVPLSRLSPIVEILRHPSSLMDVYYCSMFQQLFGSKTCKDTVVNEFFEKNENEKLAKHVELQIQKSKHYTNYLRKQGLFVADERSQHLQEVLKKVREMMQTGRTGENKDIEKINSHVKSPT